MRVTGLYAPLEILLYAMGEHKKPRGKMLQGTPWKTNTSTQLHSAFMGKFTTGLNSVSTETQTMLSAVLKKPIVTIQ